MFEATGNLVAYQWLGLSPDERLGAAVQFFVMDVLQIFFLLALIIYVMGLFRTLMSPEQIGRASCRERVSVCV